MGGGSANSNGFPFLYTLLLVSSLLFSSGIHAFNYEELAINQSLPQMPAAPKLKGLSFDFYLFTCPQLPFIVRNHLTQVFRQDPGQAPALLRIFFHDCWVEACDGSILLDGGERDHRNNVGIRPEALRTIESLRAIIHSQCRQVVSCADITVLAAREAVLLSGGPFIPVALGRRDSLTFNVTAVNDLPSPFSKTSQIISHFEKKGFNHIADLVALSGAHAFSRAHCGSFSNRLSNDATIDPAYANLLRTTCPSPQSENVAFLDRITPFAFDDRCYVELQNRWGLFTSDQDLFDDARSRPWVNTFALNQLLFFNWFAGAFQRVAALDVLTGSQGEIRAQCNVRNSQSNNNLNTLMQLAEEFSSQF